MATEEPVEHSTTLHEHEQRPEETETTKFHSAFFERLWGYGLVNYTYQKVSNLYNTVKNSNSLMQYALQTAENNVYKVATPLAYKVLNQVAALGQPVLTEVDDFGCRQLDRLEDKLSRPFGTATYVPYVMLDKALNVTEGTLDYLLPPHKESQAKDKYYEDQAKQELQKGHSFAEQGQDYESTKSNFRYLKCRLRGQVYSLAYRMRERVASVPLAVPLVNFVELQFNRLSNLNSFAWELAAKGRARVQNLAERTRNLVAGLVGAFWLFLSSLTVRMQGYLQWAVTRFVSLFPTRLRRERGVQGQKPWHQQKGKKVELKKTKVAEEPSKPPTDH